MKKRAFVLILMMVFTLGLFAQSAMACGEECPSGQCDKDDVVAEA